MNKIKIDPEKIIEQGSKETNIPIKKNDLVIYEGHEWMVLAIQGNRAGIFRMGGNNKPRIKTAFIDRLINKSKLSL